MTQDTSTYYVWIGGSCDYGHKEPTNEARAESQARLGYALQEGGRRSQRAGGAAVVIEHNGSIISRDVISDLHTTEFRIMLTLMVKVMQEIPESSDIIFLTNAAYIQNFDKTPTSKSANRTSSESKDASSLAISAESRGKKARANSDLIIQCIEEKKRHKSVGVKIVQYHKSPLLIETHDRATEAMAKTRKEFHQKLQ